MTERRRRPVLALAICVGAVLALLPAAPAFSQPAPDRRPGRPLTPPSSADALDVSLGYLRDHRASMGLAADDLDGLAVTDRYRTPRTGTTHLYLRQQVDGIEVDGGDVAMSIDAEGRVRTVGDRLIRGLRARLTNRAPLLSAADAVLDAAEHLGLGPGTVPQVVSSAGGSDRAVVLSAAGLSRDPIRARLVYALGDAGALRLAWDLVLRTVDGRHWWNVKVDADDGRVLRQDDWIKRDAYLVHPLPLSSPDEGARSLVVGPADPVASPFGWHDTNGSPGAEFTDTRGNNVYAQDDVDGDDAGGLRPSGGPGLEFSPPLDPTMQPGNYLDASVTNLFYWTNVVHDVLYRYGFDEPAGNFQINNYGNGGSGGDAVMADAQDGAGVDNAQFGTPPDGNAPRMEMFRWLLPPTPRLVVSSPSGIAGTYFAGMGLFGGGTIGINGFVVQALDPADGAGPSTTDGCSPFTNAGAVSGNIAIIDRGDCLFVEKVANAQDAGAIGAIVVNDAGNETVNMAGIDPTLTIPAIFIGQANGALIEGELAGGVVAMIVTPAARDSSLDSGVVVHEYGHGVSARLTNGPSSVTCLNAAESAAMGEGFGDWLSLVFTAKPGDGAADPRGIASYLVDEGPGGGIRNYPYSIDLGVSPLTYGDLPGLDQPHGGGEIWAAALWEMYWNLVFAHGYDPDLYAGTGGNNLALQLVLDGMKMQPCSPTMVDARDAILAADAVANGGANECLIWVAFAKRGLGEDASDGGSAGTLAVSEAFDVPVTCVPEPGRALGLVAGLCLLRGLARRRRVPAVDVVRDRAGG